MFGAFLGNILKKTGSALRSVGNLGGHVLRKFGMPVAHALKPLASTIHGFLPQNSGTAMAGNVVNKGLDYVASGRAAGHVQGGVGGIGDRLHALGSKLHRD